MLARHPHHFWSASWHWKTFRNTGLLCRIHRLLVTTSGFTHKGSVMQRFHGVLAAQLFKTHAGRFRCRIIPSWKKHGIRFWCTVNLSVTTTSIIKLITCGSRRQRSILLGGRYRQVSLYQLCSSLELRCVSLIKYAQNEVSLITIIIS